jgi:hypothetical protein
MKRGVWILVLFGLTGIGTVFTAAGGTVLFFMRRRHLMNQWLRVNGLRVETRFGRVELNTSLTVNGSHPYRIVSQWLNPRSNQVHVFHSENLWYDPAPYIPGATVDVWIDPNDPKRYLMETGFLPREAS